MSPEQTKADLIAEMLKLQKELERLKAENSDLKIQVGSTTFKAESLRERLHKSDEALKKIKEEIAKLRATVAGLELPPIASCRYSHEGKITSVPDEKGNIHEVPTCWVYISGRKDPVQRYIDKDIAERFKDKLVLGQLLEINEATQSVVNIIPEDQQDSFNIAGKEVTVDEVIDGKTVRIVIRMDEKSTVMIPQIWTPEARAQVKPQSKWRVSPDELFLVNKPLPQQEVQQYLLEEIPDTLYSMIGGLGPQIEKIRDALELPFLYENLFLAKKIPLPKGVLFYGPPGCGKTLMARAVVNHLANRISEELKEKIQGYFINVKGPELLNKYVGESERKIREIFEKAKEKAKNSRSPVLVFIDEAESLLRTRGMGISSDVESTIVPQFLCLLDGMEKIKNVILILASNRHDLIDPAILRPGRIDKSIKIGRPDFEGTKEILSKYVIEELGVHPKYLDRQHPKWKPGYEKFEGNHQAIIDYIIEETTKRIWATPENPYIYRSEGKEIQVDSRLLEITNYKGDKKIIYMKDIVSGAMIESIVTKGKILGVKRIISGGEDGIRTSDFCIAVEQATEEIEELPSTPEAAQRWCSIQDIKTDGPIVAVKSFVDERKKKEKEKPKKVVEISTGHYL